LTNKTKIVDEKYDVTKQVQMLILKNRFIFKYHVIANSIHYEEINTIYFSIALFKYPVTNIDINNYIKDFRIIYPLVKRKSIDFWQIEFDFNETSPMT